MLSLTPIFFNSMISSRLRSKALPLFLILAARTSSETSFESLTMSSTLSGAGPGAGWAALRQAPAASRSASEKTDRCVTIGPTVRG